MDPNSTLGMPKRPDRQKSGLFRATCSEKKAARIISDFCLTVSEHIPNMLTE
jgi:hypothetical protein